MLFSFVIAAQFSEELNDLYSSPNIIRVIKPRRMRPVGHVACMGKRRCPYSVLVGNTEGKRPPGILRHIWEGNTKNCIVENKRKLKQRRNILF
jgi:hypothetical protein